LLASALTGKRPRIALSNESSANESTVSGTEVNHQYSKSFEFEQDFRSYVADNISKQFNYYSFLRPLTELQIAMLFSQYGHYHDVFKSCNVGSKEDIWCGHCAKCLFAYIILSPFLEPQRLNAVFGKNMLDDASLQKEFDQLIGKAETKPFECVGTVSEVNDALSMTIAKWYASANQLPALLQSYRPMSLSSDVYSIIDEHNLADDDRQKLVGVLRKPAQIERLLCYRELFNFFVGREVLIAGYGREGKSTHNFLQRLFPTRRFDIATNNDEIDTALKNKRYDIIIKSPGIPTFFFEGKCDLATITSQTDIFLRFCGVSVIGVTGTKGKSTTANLIYHVLNSSGFDTVMAGNMGIPLFDILDQLNPHTIVVAEFSCHQLENIHKGPQTAVLLNLFQEHLDHYHDYDDYQNAKMQIALKQTMCDRFIYCSDNSDLQAKVIEYKDSIKSDIIAYSLVDAKKASFIANAKCELKGDHNLSDIYAAWLAVNCYSVGEKELFVKALESFRPLEHRLEKVATKDGVTYYNDSISTIPQTTIAAIEALKDVDTLILGGFNRGIDYKPLTDYLMNEPLGRKVENIVLFGSAGEAIAKELSGRNMMCHFGADYSMAEAVAFAAANTAKGSICLLSPAASSYDRYKNFEYRGRDFKDEVAKLK
jgi:UDP-N-acetylmuramoylalanine--D-glutamate ligase